MPEYDHGGMKFRRKNMYLPCIIAARDLTDEEYAIALKAAYWADNITSAQWPVVLQHDDFSPVEKSRLKKKAAGWVMALERIARIHPELFTDIVKKAEAMYREQIEAEPVVKFVFDGSMFQDGVPNWVTDDIADIVYGKPIDWHPEDDTKEEGR
jgi:hypothetical protein